MTRLGIGVHERLPSESTIRRTLAAVDGDDLDRRVATWMAVQVGQLAGRTVIAVDGKSLRGGTPHGGAMPHLLAALHHASGVVTGQRAVATKSNEIPALPLLLADIDLAGVVVTADALCRGRHKASTVTTTPVRSKHARRSRTAGISLLFAATWTCPITVPVTWLWAIT